MTDRALPDALALFGPDGDGATGLFLDTSGLVPLFTTRAGYQHDQVTALFDAIRENRLPYRPLVTNHYVLDELVSLLLSRTTPETTADALRRLQDSRAIRVLPVQTEEFDRAVEAFDDLDDKTFSLTDHVVAVQAAAHGISHALTYDDDFRALGFSAVPRL